MKTGLLVLPSIPSTKDPPSASWGGGERSRGLGAPST